MTILHDLSKKNFKILKKTLDTIQLPRSVDALKSELDRINNNQPLPFMTAFCGFCLKGLFGFLDHSPFFHNYGENRFANMCSDCYEKCVEILNAEESK